MRELQLRTGHPYWVIGRRQRCDWSTEMSSCWLPAGIALLLILSTCVDGRAALPAALAPGPSAPRSAIIITQVPQAQGPATPEGFVNLPNTKGIIHIDDLAKTFRPAEGPVASQAAETRAEVANLLARANAVSALRRAGLIRTTSGMSRFLQNRTIEAWNAQAPLYKTPGGDMKPVLAQSVHSPDVKSLTDQNTIGANGYVVGATLELLFGIRIATPFFGTGFNFCIDRYFGTFPKVGIVVPNFADWILPDLRDILGPTLGITMELPQPGSGGLPIGSRVNPTSDGFLIWLPSTQPKDISNFAFRYGLQLAQLFGTDFGFGWLRQTCGVDFVRV